MPCCTNDFLTLCKNPALKGSRQRWKTWHNLKYEREVSAIWPLWSSDNTAFASFFYLLLRLYINHRALASVTHICVLSTLKDHTGCFACFSLILFQTHNHLYNIHILSLLRCTFRYIRLTYLHFKAAFITSLTQAACDETEAWWLKAFIAINGVHFGLVTVNVLFCNEYQEQKPSLCGGSRTKAKYSTPVESWIL